MRNENRTNKRNKDVRAWNNCSYRGEVWGTVRAWTHSALERDQDNDVFEGAREWDFRPGVGYACLVLLLLERGSSVDISINAEAVKDTFIQLGNFQYVFPQFSRRIHCHERNAAA